MYLTDLRGLRIFSLMSALKMGAVDDALLDPSCRYVAAMVVRAYGPGSRRLVPRTCVKRVGRNAVILAGTDDAPYEGVLEGADRLINLRTFIGLEVVSDYGNLVGRIHNAVIDAQTLAVEEYEMESRPLDRLVRHRGLRRISAHQTLSASKDVLIIPEALLTAPAEGQTELIPDVRGRWLPSEVLGSGEPPGIPSR
jgi:sporulation protein YlmC with PRC-barrel domain